MMKWIYSNPSFENEIETIKKSAVSKRLALIASTTDVNVYDINPGEKRYVLKEFHGASNKMREFIHEIEYGTRRELLKGVHVRIHAYWINPAITYGMFISDHVSFGAKDVRQTMTANEYMKSPQFDLATFTTKFSRALQGFYRAFNGFHGDLHSGNVMVNLDFRDRVKSVVIIDYANITPFVNPNKHTRSIKNVQNTFKAIPERGVSRMNFPEGSGIQVKWTRNDVPVRSNVNMLNKLPQWKSVRVFKNLF